MKKKIILLVLFLSPIFAFSQVNYSVRGKAVAPEGYLPMGNVIALNPTDSSFIKGAAFFEGDFQIDGLVDEEILLVLTSLEFDDTYLRVSYNGSQVVDLGEVPISNSGALLSEVVVNAERPVFNRRSDGTTEVLIENTTLATSNSTIDILSKIPNVVVVDGGISVFGKGEAIIFLNGRRITNEQLSMVQPTNVKTIEVIRNPSAKYDAEGGAVIHITTIQNEQEGYQINLRENISYSPFGGPISYSNIDIGHNKGKFSSKAYYTLQVGEDRMKLFTTRDRDEEATYLRTTLITDNNRDFENYSYYGLGVQYNIADDKYVSVEYSGYYEKTGGNWLSQNNIVDRASSNYYESDIHLNEKDRNNSLSFNYNNAIDTLGSNLFIGGQYSNFDITTDNFITERSELNEANSSRLLKSLLDLQIDIFTGRVDYTKVFRNKSSIEFGGKFSYVDNGSTLNFLVSEVNSDYTIDPDLSNAFSYQETIGGAYFTFKDQLSSKLKYSVGLRAEHTQYDLNVSQEGTKQIEDIYFNVFPNLSAIYTFSEKHSIGLTYTSRINRPEYESLNPVLIYQDPYTSVQGNPELLPQRMHAFELNSTVGNTSFSVGYNYTNSPAYGVALRGDDDYSYVLTTVNLEAKRELYASVSHTFSIGLWTSSNTISVNYDELKEGDYNYEQVAVKPYPYLYTNNKFKISNSLNAEVIFWYLGDIYQGIYHRNDMHTLTLAVNKSFFNNALNVRAIADDVFHGYIASGDYNVGETDIYYNRRWSTNFFKLAVTYNFGKLKKAKYNNKAAGTEEMNRAR